MNWLTLWPSWSRSWYGWLLRPLIGGAAVLSGLGLLFLANYGANYGANVNLRTTEWDGEALAVLLCGLVMIAVAVWVFARPSKASIIALVVSVFTTMLVGAVI